MAASAAKLEEEERERKREAIRARIAAQRAAKGEEEPATGAAPAENGGQQAVTSAATEQERKREEIRQRIAAQKAAEEAEQRAVAAKAERERQNGELQKMVDQMDQASLHSEGPSGGQGAPVRPWMMLTGAAHCICVCNQS